MKASIFVLWLTSLLSACAAVSAPPAQSSLVGTYRVVSFQAVPEGEAPVDVWGKEPRGYIVITPQRFTTVLTAQDRKVPAGPPTAQELAALFMTQVAYTGPYRVEGNRLITKVDASSFTTWVGTEQVREFKMEGNRLYLSTLRGPIPAMLTKTGRAHLVWEKIE